MLLTERYADRIQLVLSCFDRVILGGTLPEFCHAEAATRQLYMRKIRIFDFPQFVKGLREQIRATAEALAAQNGLKIEFLRSSHLRKEDRIQEILDVRGRAPGLVHIVSALESCVSFEPWHNKRTGRTYLRPTCGRTAASASTTTSISSTRSSGSGTALLPARADLGALSIAVLLQRP